MYTIPDINSLILTLDLPSNPVGMRTRATYYLRQTYENAVHCLDDAERETLQSKIIAALGKNLLNRDHGTLMRHEFAYVMGQLRDEKCHPTLEKCLSDTTDCPIVRHECAEALAAIGSLDSLPLLQQLANNESESVEVSQTCQIAVDYMTWRQNGEDAADQPAACACMLSPYSSVDPAPAHPSHQNLSTLEIGKILLDESRPLFERYRAMFSLRNRGGEKAALQLGRALVLDSSSALFRHEVAYVLGQMQHPASLESLVESLGRKNEHAMVRHEAAEAIGAIEERWSECEKVLKDYCHDKDVIVAESCMVALDSMDYWSSAYKENEKSDVIASEKFNDTLSTLKNHFNIVS